MPGKIDENNIIRPPHIHTHLRDQRFHQLICGLCPQYKLHICRRPLASLRIDQPLGKGPRIGLGKLQWSEGSILIFIDTYDESQASAHKNPFWVLSSLQAEGGSISAHRRAWLCVPVPVSSLEHMTILLSHIGNGALCGGD